LYERIDDGVWLATSTDGPTFAHVDDKPALTCGPEPYDRHAIAVDQIVRYASRSYPHHASPGAALSRVPRSPPLLPLL